MQKTDYITGLVIKDEPYGDNAKIIHVLTHNNGILRLKATGANNIKGSYYSAIQPFTYSEFSVAKGRGGYFTITGGVVKNGFFKIGKNIETYTLACYFSSAVTRVAVNDDASDDILRLILNCLYAMSELGYSAERVKPVFEIKLASVCGFAPDFRFCSECGKESDGFLFDFFSFGTVCKSCWGKLGVMEKSERYIKLSQNIVNIIEFICNCNLKHILSVNVSEDSFIFREFAERLACHIYEKTPKALLIYNQLMRSIRNEKLRQE